MINEYEVRDRINDFLEKYGDKGYLVLRTALDIALDPAIDHKHGDFSYKHLVFKLRRTGINYNPSNLLRILEREYGLIHKTYISTTQKWWSFIDLEAVRKTLLEYSGSTEAGEPRLRILLIKYRSLDPVSLLNTLRRLAMKSSLNSVDKQVFRKIVFNELDAINEILNEMMAYEDVFHEEIRVLNEIISLAERISAKIGGLHSGLRVSVKRESMEHTSLGEDNY